MNSSISGETGTAVYIEAGKRRAFGCALEWPGWCRSGKSEAEALDALADYAPRYAAVAGEAGLDFPAGAAERLRVVERLPGSATTDFGAPGEIAGSDAEPLTAGEASRLARLVSASWRIFDRVVATAPAALRKGPRGGGRDRDAIVDHVLGAETVYARKMGVRCKQPKLGDIQAVSTLRQSILEALERAADSEAVREWAWPPRYAARRIAWHVLDHAWEIEDRGDLAP